jgi:hypothetical protein
LLTRAAQLRISERQLGLDRISLDVSEQYGFSEYFVGIDDGLGFKPESGSGSRRAIPIISHRASPCNSGDVAFRSFQPSCDVVLEEVA